MRLKKVVAGLLTAAMVMTSVQVSAAENKVTAGVPEEGLVASFTFDDATLSNGKAADATAASAMATAVVPGDTECGVYTGDVKYVAGKSGRGVRIQNHGLKLNQENLGKNYSVSLWIKPDGNISTNASVLFFGRKDKADTWAGIAGNNNNSECKFWVNGTTADGNVGWQTIAKPLIDSTAWHHLVVTGSEDAAVVYVDGNEITKIQNIKIPNALDGEGRDVMIGVTAWDAPFGGTVDEVNVYNKTLSEAEVTALYNATKDATISKEDLFAWGSISASIAGGINKGETKNISVTLPDGVAANDVTISYESDKTSVATVDKNGVVAGVAAGTATITVTVAMGETTKTADVKVSVVDNTAVDYPKDLVAYYNFDDGTINNAIAKEGSSQATLRTAGNGDYNGNAEFDSSINDSKGSAIKMGSYGLKLNQKNLGKEFTVSLWLKPNSKIANNGAVTLLGHNSPENWYAVAGQGNDANETKIWAKDDTDTGLYSWSTLSTQTFNKDWHHITFVGTDGELSFYMDGVKKWTKDSSNPLDGSGDILVGLTYWPADACFPGLVDEIKVFNTAKTEADVSNLDKELFNEMLQSSVNAGLTDAVLLGKNTDSTNVKYNLNLPTELDGIAVAWTSSDPDVIAADGTVNNQAEAKEVTLTAKATAGVLEVSRELKVTVAALSRDELDQLVTEAKTIDTAYATAESKARLENAIAAGEAAKSYEEVETATTELIKAINGLKLTEAYANPFGLIAEPVAKQTMKVGDTPQVLYVPDDVKAATTITYLSSNDNVVTYVNGVATAKAEGKATVTAIVTSKYNNYVMEYSVAFDITKADEPVVTPPVTNTPVKKPEISLNKVTLGVGEKVSLKVTNATGKVSYSTSNKKYATVSSTGKITGKKAGKATITAKLADGTKLTCKVTVKNAPKKITLSKKSISLKKGKTYQIKAKLPSKTASYKITYKTNNKKVATVSASGKVTAKKKGKATITVTTFNKKKATLKVTVK